MGAALRDRPLGRLTGLLLRGEDRTTCSAGAGLGVVVSSEWDEQVTSLVRLSTVPAARALGALLADAGERWEGRVVPLTSMHDLVFTVPGQSYPFEALVNVSWKDDVFTIRLEERGGLVRAADHCREANAPAVLDAFLVQLVEGEPSPATGRDTA